jgi:hypothetical protein
MFFALTEDAARQPTELPAPDEAVLSTA